MAFPERRDSRNAYFMKKSRKNGKLVKNAPIPALPVLLDES
jgi:hypothetical protein